MRLQDSPVDMICFYTADTSAWSMFGQFGIPTKVFYAFKAFNQLALLPDRVACEASLAQGVTACAGLAADKESAAVLLANFKGEPRSLALSLRNLPWTGLMKSRTQIQKVPVTDCGRQRPALLKYSVSHELSIHPAGCSFSAITSTCGGCLLPGGHNFIS